MWIQLLALPSRRSHRLTSCGCVNSLFSSSPAPFANPTSQSAADPAMWDEEDLAVTGVRPATSLPASGGATICRPKSARPPKRASRRDTDIEARSKFFQLDKPPSASLGRPLPRVARTRATLALPATLTLGAHTAKGLRAPPGTPPDPRVSPRTGSWGYERAEQDINSSDFHKYPSVASGTPGSRNRPAGFRPVSAAMAIADTEPLLSFTPMRPATSVGTSRLGDLPDGLSVGLGSRVAGRSMGGTRAVTSVAIPSAEGVLGSPFVRSESEGGWVGALRVTSVSWA